MPIQSLPNIQGGVFNLNNGHGSSLFNTPTRITDSDIKSGDAFLTSELEKLDNIIREPLKSSTWVRDIPVEVGGGWVEFTSGLNVDYGMQNSNNDTINAGVGNTIPIIQVNLSKDVYNTHIFTALLRIAYVDMMRGRVTKRNLEDLLQNGMRTAYDLHMDECVYNGIVALQQYGLLNNPNVTVSNVAGGSASGNPTEWSKKTPDEILTDINNAIIQVWNAGENDLAALPNHILIPHEQYNTLATRKVSDIGEKTILTFIEENNISQKNNVKLFIGSTKWCKKAGASQKDRMVVYVHDRKYLRIEELVPLHRAMNGTNLQNFSNESLYAANISEVEMLAPQLVGYFDGI